MKTLPEYIYNLLRLVNFILLAVLFISHFQPEKTSSSVINHDVHPEKTSLSVAKQNFPYGMKILKHYFQGNCSVCKKKSNFFPVVVEWNDMQYAVCAICADCFGKIKIPIKLPDADDSGMIHIGLYLHLKE